MSGDQDDATASRKFEVDSEALEKAQSENKKPAKRVDAGKQLKKKSGRLALEKQVLPGERRRKEKSKDQIEKEKAEAASALKIASYQQRIQGGAIDLAVCAGLFIVSKLEALMIKTEELLFLVLDSGGIKLEFSDTILDYTLIGINFFIMYFIVQVCFTAFKQKSIGKMLSGTHLISFDSDKVGLFQAIKRELILKPLGVVFLVGFVMPFFSEDNESFHDKFGGTLVAKDRK